MCREHCCVKDAEKFMFRPHDCMVFSVHWLGVSQVEPEIAIKAGFGSAGGIFELLSRPSTFLASSSDALVTSSLLFLIASCYY